MPAQGELTVRVWLPDHETRCWPSACTDRDNCGRYLAQMPTRGATLADFSLERSPSNRTADTRCAYWLAASECTPPTAAGPKVHEAQDGLT